MNTRQNVDYTSRDYEGFRNDMITMLKAKIPEYSDFSESDMGIVLIELLAHGLDILSYYNDRVANEIFPDTAIERESIIKHCRRLGYELKNAVPSRYYQVFKILPQPHTYVVPRGTKVITKGDDRVEFELMEDISIPPNCNGLEKDSHGNYLYKGLIEHGSTIESDIIGTSNGTPYQEFTLSYSPVILDSLRVFIRDQNGIEEWKRADNFIDSDVSSKQFVTETLDNDYVKVLFGSGMSGTIPPIYDNGISASYRIGGGTVGNVSLEMITEMPSRPAVIIDTMNVEQVQLGTDKETIEEARVHAPQSLRTLWRAVSLEDYQNLLLREFQDEIHCCKAIAEDDRFTISIYTLIKESETLPESYKKRYLAFLDERKEIGYDIKFYPPTFSDYTLALDVVTNRAYTNNEIKDIVQAYLDTNLSLGNYKFGEKLRISQMIKDIMSLPGIIDVNITPTGSLTPTSSQILRLTKSTINVTGGI